MINNEQVIQENTYQTKLAMLREDQKKRDSETDKPYSLHDNKI